MVESAWVAPGAHVILDCYQSIGTLPIDVVDLGVSFACGGSVKYVCGGPGAAWLYVRKDLNEQFAPRVTGWFGHEAPFAFTMPEQQYAETVWRYMGGTPAIAALYQSRAGQSLIAEIGVRIGDSAPVIMILASINGRRLHWASADRVVSMWSGFRDDLEGDLLEEGVSGLGYMLKERVSEIDEVVRALHEVARGGSALDPKIVEGLRAQAIQHEIDHLDGKLYIDYLSSLKRERILKKLRKQQQRDNA